MFDTCDFVRRFRVQRVVPVDTFELRLVGFLPPFDEFLPFVTFGELRSGGALTIGLVPVLPPSTGPRKFGRTLS